MRCEITHLHSSSNYVLDTLVDRFHYRVFMCIWLQFNVNRNHHYEWELLEVMWVIMLLFPSLSPFVCLYRRTQWMEITCGWRRAVRESSVISARTPAFWRLQWVLHTLTTRVCVCVCVCVCVSDGVKERSPLQPTTAAATTRAVCVVVKSSRAGKPACRDVTSMFERVSELHLGGIREEQMWKIQKNYLLKNLSNMMKHMMYFTWRVLVLAS